MRLLADHPLQPGMRHAADPCRAERIDVVIESLEGETVEVDEVAGHLDADDVRLPATFDHADREAVDQDRTARTFHPAASNQIAASQRVLGLDQVLDELPLVIAHGAAQTPHQEATGARVSFQLASQSVGQGVDPLSRLFSDDQGHR